MDAMGSDVVHFHNGAFGDLALYAKVPLFRIRKWAGLRESSIIGETQGIRSRVELNDVRLGILDIVGSHSGQSLRQLERLRNTRTEVVKGLLHGIAREKNLAAEIRENPGVEDAKA